MVTRMEAEKLEARREMGYVKPPLTPEQLQLQEQIYRESEEAWAQRRHAETLQRHEQEARAEFESQVSQQERLARRHYVMEQDISKWRTAERRRFETEVQTWKTEAISELEEDILSWKTERQTMFEPYLKDYKGYYKGYKAWLAGPRVIPAYDPMVYEIVKAQQMVRPIELTPYTAFHAPKEVKEQFIQSQMPQPLSLKPSMQTQLYEKQFYEKLGYSKFAGKYPAFTIPEGYQVKAIKEMEKTLDVTFEPVPEAKGIAEQMMEFKVTPLLSQLGFRQQPIFTPKGVQTKYEVSPLGLPAGVIASGETLVYSVARLAGFETPRPPPTVSGGLVSSGIESFTAMQLKRSAELQQAIEYGPGYAAGTVVGDILIAMGISKGAEVGYRGLKLAVGKLKPVVSTTKPYLTKAYQYTIKKHVIEPSWRVFRGVAGEEAYFYTRQIVMPNLPKMIKAYEAKTFSLLKVGITKHVTKPIIKSLPRELGTFTYSVVLPNIRHPSSLLAYNIPYQTFKTQTAAFLKETLGKPLVIGKEAVAYVSPELYSFVHGVALPNIPHYGKVLAPTLGYVKEAYLPRLPKLSVSVHMPKALKTYATFAKSVVIPNITHPSTYIKGAIKRQFPLLTLTDYSRQFSYAKEWLLSPIKEAKMYAIVKKGKVSFQVWQLEKAITKPIEQTSKALGKAVAPTTQYMKVGARSIYKIALKPSVTEAKVATEIVKGKARFLLGLTVPKTVIHTPFVFADVTKEAQKLVLEKPKKVTKLEKKLRTFTTGVMPSEYAAPAVTAYTQPGVPSLVQWTGQQYPSGRARQRTRELEETVFLTYPGIKLKLEKPQRLITYNLQSLAQISRVSQREKMDPAQSLRNIQRDLQKSVQETSISQLQTFQQRQSFQQLQVQQQKITQQLRQPTPVIPRLELPRARRKARKDLIGKWYFKRHPIPTARQQIERQLGLRRAPSRTRKRKHKRRKR